MFQKDDLIQKMCSIYVSDVHFTTMLLPYIATQLEKGNMICPILEKELTANVEMLLSKWNIKKKLKDQIQNVNWKKKELYKYTQLEKYLDESIRIGKTLFSIVVGNETYRKAMNENIERYVQNKESELRRKHIKIHLINGYEIMDFKENMQQILDEHDKILNTSGEKEIEEVFDGYEKKQIG